MKHGKTIRYTAWLTVLIYVITNHLGFSLAHAAEIAPPSQAQIQTIDLNTLKVPDQFGEVVESFTGKSNQSVILIQDAHSIADAQKNIANLITHFEKNYGINSVALEGASGDLDPQIFKSFPDKKLLREVFKTYLDAGEVAGGTAAAIFGDAVAEYRGVEDWEKYQDGLALYLAALEKQPALSDQLSAVRQKLNAEKEKAYPEELIKVDRAVEKFYSDASETTDLLKVLGAIQTPKSGGGLETVWREISKGQETGDKGQQTKDVEVREILDRIEKFLNTSVIPAKAGIQVAQRVKQDALKAFNFKKQAWQTGEISTKAFALYLKETAQKFGLHVEMSSELLGMVREQRRLKDLEGTKIFRELEEYIEAAEQQAGGRSSEVRELRERTKELRLLTKLVKLELSRSEWDAIKARDRRPEARYKKNASADDSSGVREALSRGDVNGWFEIAGISAADLVYHLSFYANAEERDEIFFKNIQTMSSTGRWTGSTLGPRASGLGASIMVAGGFHAEGLTQRFKQAGISYVLVMPKIKHLPEHSAYQSQMRGEVSWKNYFEVENGRINLYKAFVRAVRDKLIGGDSSGVARGIPRGGAAGSSDLLLLKSWRDQIIRDLSDQNKVERAGRYTKFLDEILDPKSVIRNQQSDDKLMGKVEKFINGLFSLQKQNQFNSQNIANLLKTTAAQVPYFGSALVPSARLKPRSEMLKNLNLPVTESAHSESHAALLPPVSGLRPKIARSEARKETKIVYSSDDYDLTKIKEYFIEHFNARFGGDWIEDTELSPVGLDNPGYNQTNNPLKLDYGFRDEQFTAELLRYIEAGDRSKAIETMVNHNRDKGIIVTEWDDMPTVAELLFAPAAAPRLPRSMQGTNSEMTYNVIIEENKPPVPVLIKTGSDLEIEALLDQIFERGGMKEFVGVVNLPDGVKGIAYRIIPANGEANFDELSLYFSTSLLKAKVRGGLAAPDLLLTRFGHPIPFDLANITDSAGGSIEAFVNEYNQRYQELTRSEMRVNFEKSDWFQNCWVQKGKR